MRTISQIANEIARDWKKPYFGAVPYLYAMRSLNTVQNRYGADSGEGIVLYFLANASTWHGPVARQIKAELKALVKS